MKSKKLVFVILFIFILTLFLNLGVYATTVPRPSEPYTYPYWIIYEDKYGLKMWESRYPFKVSLKSEQLDSFYVAGPAFLWRVGTWSLANVYYTDEGGTNYKRFNADGFTILYANHDILNSSNGTVFFSKTLPVSRKDTKEVLKENPPLTLMKSRLVGLIPLSIGLLIVSVGFYKGLSVLFKALRQA